jgi:ribosome-associated protein
MGRRSTSDDILDGAAQEPEGPSKSQRKRAATAAQKLGERLIALPEADLTSLPLPERLLDAIRSARAIRSHGGLARQRQYIGKLMRDVDPQPIIERLEAGSRAQALATERFRRVEAWRDRLIAEGEPALIALAASQPVAPDQHAQLTKILRRARRKGSSEAQRTAAARTLFRTLRTLIAPCHDGTVR